jgi:hypothetical protein
LEREDAIAEMISIQEELDWEVYGVYGLVDDSVRALPSAPPLALGTRAFEIVMARQMAAGELETTWFERHGARATTELPKEWSDEYRDLVERRLALIESNNTIGLLERPEYKRRWSVVPSDTQQERERREWLLNRLERADLWLSGELSTLAKLSDRVRNDSEFMRMAELYRGRPDFDVLALVTELVESEAVPFLPILRYSPSGLRKLVVWEHTWECQRCEDDIYSRTRVPQNDPRRLSSEDAAAQKREIVSDLTAPPRYTAADFVNSTFWRLRGKLDVSKERFVSYPYLEREADPTLVIGWAGWRHLQQAKAIAEYYIRMKEQEGWTPDRLKPLLAGLVELIPWLKQWHNGIDQTYGIGMGDYFAGFVDEEARALGFTVDDLRAWQPPAERMVRRRRANL